MANQPRFKPAYGVPHLNLRSVYSGYNSGETQIPSAGDTWVNAEIDTIDDIYPGYIVAEDSGSSNLDRFRILRSGTYQVSVSFEYAAFGAAGATAILLGRRLINGSQFGTTTSSMMGTQNHSASYILSRWFTFDYGDTLEYQFAYDDNYIEAGLQAKVVPVALNANPSPCFGIRFDIP